MYTIYLFCSEKIVIPYFRCCLMIVWKGLVCDFNVSRVANVTGSMYILLNSRSIPSSLRHNASRCIALDAPQPNRTNPGNHRRTLPSKARG